MAPTISLIINAGGQSRRMGQNKALLPTPPTGQPLLQHMLQRLQTLPVDRIFVVANGSWPRSFARPDRAISILPDERPDGGPLGGIATGLRASTGWGMVLACDLPLVNPAVVQHLCSLVEEGLTSGGAPWQAIVPVVDGFAQTLHALYHRSILTEIDQRIAVGDLHTHHILQNVRTRWVSENELRPIDPELRSFFNANTVEEWAKACALLESEAQCDRYTGV